MTAAFQVFISYSRLDAHQMRKVKQIIGSLVPNNAIFVDTYSIPSGTKWLPVLTSALVSSEVFFIVWTRNACRSKFVRREVDLAISMNKKTGRPRIVPLVFEDAEKIDTIYDFQIIEMGPNNSEKLKQTPLLIIVITIFFIAMFTITNTQQKPVPSMILLVSIWFAVTLFGGLRLSSSPWQSTSATLVPLLFSTINVPRPVASLSLLYCIILAMASIVHIVLT